MSKEVVSKKQAKKTGLGRGLGSLLGGPMEDEPPAKKTQAPPVAKPVVAKKVEMPNKVLETNTVEVVKSQIKEDFIEETPRVVQPKINDEDRVWTISIDKLRGNKEQPRKYFDKEALSELSDSIKVQGILQPIVARKDGESFEIIAGERRWRAAQQAGLHEVPVILKNIGNQKALELALIENIQREDLNPIEEAKAYAHLMKEFGLTQQQLAEKVGKERATIANLLRLLNLVPEVQNHVALGEISMGQAKLLLSVLDAKKQKSIAKKVIKKSLTVKATEKLVNKVKNAQIGEDIDLDEALEENVSSRLITGLSEELQKLLGTKVTIDYNSGKGKLSVHFYSDDELNSFVDRVRKEWQK